jgi:hypothetical protein
MKNAFDADNLFLYLTQLIDICRVEHTLKITYLTCTCTCTDSTYYTNAIMSVHNARIQICVRFAEVCDGLSDLLCHHTVDVSCTEISEESVRPRA